METHFQVESARLAVVAGHELLLLCLDVQSFPGKSPGASKSCVANVLDVGSSSSSSKSPSAGVMKAKGTCRLVGLKSAKKPTEGFSSGKDNINLDWDKAEKL